MDRTPGWLSGTLLLAAFALTSCSSNTPTGPTNTTSEEEQRVQIELASVPELFSDGLFESADPAGFSSRGTQGPLTQFPDRERPTSDPVLPGVGRHFWRVITDGERWFDMTFTEPDVNGRPSEAQVVVHRTFTGSFHTMLVSTTPAGDGSDSLVVQHTVKPLRDQWSRRLWLVRVPAANQGEREWRIVAASGIEVESESGPQPHIVSVQLHTGEQDVTITDPTTAIYWRDLWRAPSGVDVRVTAITEAPDDVVVLMHRGGRVMLTPNGDNTYTGVWTTQSLAGLQHFGLNALAHDTVEGDAAYRSEAWIFPYVNEGEQVADAL